MRSDVLLVLTIVLAGCGAGSRAMVGPPGSSPSYPMEVLADGDTLVVRVDQPGGANVVVYEPTLEQGRVVLEAGLWSGGAAGPQIQCFDVGRLALPDDWAERVVWRDREGAITPVAVTRGEPASFAAAACAR